jgi:hypothetical protein
MSEQVREVVFRGSLSWGSHTVTAKGWNPLFDLWQQHQVCQEEKHALYTAGNRKEWGKLLLKEAMGIHSRREACCMYAWAVPCEETLAVLTAHAPIIEIGAGTGYWAKILRDRNVDVAAYDINPPEKGKKDNDFHADTLCWTTVAQGGPEAVEQHPNSTLFLCWPYMDSTAYNCLKRYQGATVVYIGEGEGGCTASDSFFHLLDKQWEEVQSITCPQWYGVHDWLTVHRRKQS